MRDGVALHNGDISKRGHSWSIHRYKKAPSLIGLGDNMITLLIVLVIVGVCLYLVETYIPMSPPIKVVIRVVVVLILVLYLLRAFGVADVPVRLR